LAIYFKTINLVLFLKKS